MRGWRKEIGWGGIEYQVYNLQILLFPRSFCP